jgi:hypothetical protein
VDSRISKVAAVVELAGALGDAVQGLYVGGSVASGDYRPGVSDIDAVALVERPPGPETRRHLVDTHQRLGREVTGATDLHCAYVSRRHVGDGAYRHWTWAFEELFRRPSAGSPGRSCSPTPWSSTGPAPSGGCRAMSVADVRDAARSELSGYWTRALRRRAIWQQDVYVDHGVTTVGRADLTIRDGRLVTKTEAITHLDRPGSPGRDPRRGQTPAGGRGRRISAAERDQRAETVRAFVRTQIARLLA